MEYHRKIIGSSILVLLLIICVKLIAVIKDIILAYIFGLGKLTDAYFVAFQIPQTLIFLLGITILREMSSSIFSKTIELKQDRDLSILFSSIFNYALLTTVLVSLIGIILMPFIVKLLPISHYDDMDRLIVYLGRILFTMVITFGLSEYLGAVLNAFRNFFLPGFSTICANICMIVSLIMFAHKLSIASLAYGTTIGFLISCIIQFTYITSRKIFYKPFVIDFHFPLVREYIKKAIPFMIITSMSQICILVSYILSLNFGQGMASALSFAGKLNDIIINLFVLPFLTVLLPEFSRDTANNDTNTLKSHIRFGAEAIAVIVIFCTAFMIVCNQEIVQLLFMRGKFTLENAHITGNILFIYMIGLCFQAGYLYLVFIYLGIQKTSSLLFIGGTSYILNVVLQIILSHYFGVYGITAGISFASLIYFFVLLFTLKKNFISFSFFKQGRYILKIVGIIPFLIIVFIVGRKVLFTDENLKQSYLFVKLLILGGAGLFIYILCLIVLRIQIAIDLFNKIRYMFYAKNENTLH